MSMDDTIEITVWAETNKVGSRCTRTTEFEREDWESMSDGEKEDALKDIMFEMVEWGWEES